MSRPRAASPSTALTCARSEPHAWQRRVSAIFQDFTRYDLSARDNVTFGAIERANDDNALVDAARQAGALAVVEDLPHGWDTRLSR